MEPYDASLAASALSVLLETVSRCFRLETKVWVKDVEFVSLYRFLEEGFHGRSEFDCICSIHIQCVHDSDTLVFLAGVYRARNIPVSLVSLLRWNLVLGHPLPWLPLQFFLMLMMPLLAFLLDDCFNNTVSELSNLMI